MALDVHRPTPRETAWAWLPGLVDTSPGHRTTAAPLDVLTSRIADRAGDRQVYVTFSGGRDSSAVLAAACRATALAGTPPPIPVTFVYPGVAEADESEWQRTVVDHLGLHDWWRLAITTENDLLGPVAQDSLRRHGLLWPATMHARGPLLERCAGGVVLTGEGGDEVFGDRRIRALRRTARRPFAPGSPRRSALTAVSPAVLRRRRLRAPMSLPWLRPAAHDELVERIGADDLAEPLSFGGSLRWVARRRSVTEFFRTYSALAAEHHAEVAHPLLDPTFLAAVARRHPTGFSSRTEGMRAVFADVLPDAVLARTSKATFTLAYLGAATREFARSWDGSGVPHDLVDAEELQKAWLGERPPGPTGLLLQSAWLASQDRTRARDAA
ncbi:asparagine synthase-related protein [Isoptericola sp. S6320L]|uniref:asparagine synthase-related protein n=1 Tax=Isoptericola sp. S6320L TaxID=2926411 RepID=UPI001FF5EF2E|nr:asparagine synthase-related protein [Isoptericola sp. S6320L]MCK0117888.1 asparagine synthase-related protein [Isoptericola sp. S6320L]